MLIFSFRITSGKSWLIALVGFGIFNIIIGIIAATSRFDLTYPLAMLVAFLLIFVYFITVVLSKKTKSRTQVFLNLLVWLFGGCIPTVYLVYIELYQDTLMFNNTEGYFDDPQYKFLMDNIPTMFALNILLIGVGMFFLSKLIRTWKGISEE
jgi:hypothetical protein